MKLVIASDHGGFAYKQLLVPFLEDRGYQVTDLGCPSQDSVDYPDYAFPAAQAVARGDADRAILICGTGVGMSICANKVRGVRCALCGDAVTAGLCREHNDANALAMGARIIGIETAKAIVLAFLEAEYQGGRHARRLDKISQQEPR